MPHPHPHPPRPMPIPSEVAVFAEQQRAMRQGHGHGADYGPNPYVTDIAQATLRNNTYRTALWTGPHLQLTVMSIPPGQDIGLEVHPDHDQFLRIEQGQGLVQMGPAKDRLHFRQAVFDDFAVFVPAGTWHNITNVGNTPLKLYTLYGPPDHAHGTIHPTKADAEREEGH